MILPIGTAKANSCRRTGVAPLSDFKYQVWNGSFAYLTPPTQKQDKWKIQVNPFFKDGDRRDAGSVP
jgi:hypothetical protein